MATSWRSRVVAALRPRAPEKIVGFVGQECGGDEQDRVLSPVARCRISSAAGRWPPMSRRIRVSSSSGMAGVLASALTIR